MKTLCQWSLTLTLVIALLCAPAHASAFQPTRFTVVEEGTIGKPDVVLIPGLSSSRAVWDGEAKLLAPNYRLHLVQVGGFAGAPAGANASGTMLPHIVDELHRYIEALTVHATSSCTTSLRRWTRPSRLSSGSGGVCT